MSSETEPQQPGDVVAEVYHGRRYDPATQQALRARIEWICGQVRGRTLDLGCSQGIVCLLLARKGGACVGLDRRAEAIAYAQAEAAKEPPAVQALLEYRRADAARLDFPDAAFDTVILGELVEHLEQPERVLAEARRVLKPGGRLIVTTPLGVLPDPDHRQTFWFSTLLPLLESFARTEVVGLIPGVPQYIGYVGIAEPAGASALEAGALRLLRETEQSCGLREQGLEVQVASARDRARDLQAERARLEAELHAGRVALQQARDELGAITNSRGYKMLLRLRRFRRELLGGPWRVRIAYLRDAARKALGRREPTPSEQYERGVEAFLRQVARHGGDRFVVMFCATHYIQERRGNRPMRMARRMAERGIPVLYYYEGLPDALAPPPVHPLIHQCPIALGFAHFDKIARADVGRKRRLFIASFPYPECARRLDELHELGWTTVYECRDDWEEFHKAGRLDQWFGYDAAAERYLTAHADVVCAVSRPLVEKLAGFGRSKPVYLSPNAYDTAFLSPENAGRLAPRTGPAVLGYFGHLSPDWFDWEALLEMARRRPDWRFEIVGDATGIEVSAPENLRLLGLRSHAEINQIVQSWRTAIIPFKINALTRGVDPIKIYEYLALGLPTVSFTMPQIESYPYTFTAESVEAFLARAEEAMSMPRDRAAIDRFLGANRWEDRLDQMLAWADAAGRG